MGGFVDPWRMMMGWYSRVPGEPPVSGPFLIVAIEVRQAGAVAAQTRTPGAVAAQTRTPGAVSGQGEPA